MSTREDTSPEVERLRAAHSQIADPDPVLLSTVREHVLGDGARRHGTRRPRRRAALAAVAACVLTGVAVVSLDVAPRGGSGGGLPKISAVEQARAALAAPGTIVHYTVTLSRDGGEELSRDPRFADCNAGPLEVWRATDPTRWRAVQPVSDNPGCGTMDLAQGLGPVVAPRLEVSYANGRTSSYVPGRDIMLVINDEDAPADGERRAPGNAANAAAIQLFSTPPVRKPGRDGKPFVHVGSPDPVSDVERLLTESKLREHGVSMRDGRRVRVLSATSTRGVGPDGFDTTTVEYVVDAETFAPIAATTTTRMHDSGATASTRAAFADYERIPLTGESATMLEIQPERTPKVVEQTIEQIKNPK